MREQHKIYANAGVLLAQSTPGSPEHWAARAALRPIVGITDPNSERYATERLYEMEAAIRAAYEAAERRVQEQIDMWSQDEVISVPVSDEDAT